MAKRVSKKAAKKSVKPRTKSKPRTKGGKKLTPSGMEHIDVSTMPAADAINLALEKTDAIIQVPDEEYRQDLIAAYAMGQVKQELNRVDQDLNLMGWRDATATDGNSRSMSGYDLTHELRHRAILLARRLFYANGMINQMIDIWNDFTVGEGIKMHASGARIEPALKKIWNSPINANVFSIEGQRETNLRLLVDGEVPYLIAKTAKNEVKVRRIPSEQIHNIISNPDDADEIWGYHRRIPANTAMGIEVRDLYYRDWRKLGPDAGLRIFNTTTGQEEAVTWQTGMLVCPIKINTLGQRGNPICLSSFGWAQAMESFMRSRVMIERSIASFAFRIVVKGGKKDIGRVKSSLNSRISSSADRETNHGPTPGSVFFGNEGTDMEPMKFETGAKAAQIDGGMILMMLGIGAGIYPHWLGGGDSFRLATAKSMEPPMKRQFTAHQSLVCASLVNVVATAAEMLDSNIPKTQIDTLRCDAPEVMQNDLNERMNTAARIFESAQWLQLIPEVRQQLLELMGHRNPIELHAAHETEIDKVVKDWIDNKSGKNKVKPADSRAGDNPDNPGSPSIPGRKPDSPDAVQERKTKKEEEK